MVTLDSLDVKENTEKATDNNLFTNDYASDAIITALLDKEWPLLIGQLMITRKCCKLNYLNL